MVDSDSDSDSCLGYNYLRDCKRSHDIHHILPPTSALYTLLLLCFSALLILATAFYLFFLMEETSIFIVLWSSLLPALLVKLLLRNTIISKESVVVMPAFGVQLETHYAGGKISRRFIPVDKILKPLLLECVTPVTCYWNLSLIVRGEPELISVFKGLRPPATMLVPIWKALCAATDREEENSNITVEDGRYS
ncbi:GPI-GlcNAc transferase complex, PIG-H component, conserved domain containing protein [Trema orientale]|uniref:GPI-GlcNAc transferase complex, PIG-H component, conserved domain containing protein n=1 Tax=Trema orientale TaxID=63057 RepID=A0A2P5EB25_TREOI|nr:GPI-GlcNAc transferase complex, PIG-H component, conserved domain containing protein [Trema orientale]